MATRGSFTETRYTKVNNLSEVKEEDVVCGLWHDVLVTRVVLEDGVPSGAIFAVHYSWPSIFHFRCIKKEVFTIDLLRTIWILQSESLNTYPAEERIARARARIGEKKWNAMDNTSTHFCHWAIRKIVTYSDILRSRIPSSFFVGNRKVHLMDEIQAGDVVRYQNELTWDKGVVVRLRDGKNGRVFKMDVMIEKGFIATVCKKTCSINLDKDNLILCLYNPALCCSMEERCYRALGMKFKSTGLWTQWGFVDECIKKSN